MATPKSRSRILLFSYCGSRKKDVGAPPRLPLERAHTRLRICWIFMEPIRLAQITLLFGVCLLLLVAVAGAAVKRRAVGERRVDPGWWEAILRADDATWRSFFRVRKSVFNFIVTRIHTSDIFLVRSNIGARAVPVSLQLAAYLLRFGSDLTVSKVSSLLYISCVFPSLLPRATRPPSRPCPSPRPALYANATTAGMKPSSTRACAWHRL